MQTLRRRALGGFLAALAILGIAGTAQAETATPWGWPQPYEQVSPKSIAWWTG